jgi:cytochrome P450
MGIAGKRIPPGPKGWPFVGVAFEMRKDPLEGLRRFAQEYGDVVRFFAIGRERILLANPEFVQQVLVLEHSKFHKSELTRQIAGPLLGNGLLISEGEFWRRQRRLEQPAFHRARINEYASTMASLAEAHIRDWRDGDVRDVAAEMMELTLNVAVQTLFGTTLPGEAHRVAESMTFLMRYSMARNRLPYKIPENWPTPKNRRARRELAAMDAIIYKIIAERQAEKNSVAHHDLLALLMDAMDEDGSHMTPQQLHDEAITLFIAGHETTAQMLSWTWHALSQNPQIAALLREELTGVLSGRPPGGADLARLPYLQAVMNETLRLYPPAYITAREAIEPVALGGYEFTTGTAFLLSQWVSHRSPRFFAEPDAYKPERWLDGLAARLPPGAYLPFGDGPRRCIGQGFALLEAATVIGLLAQRFDFSLVPGQTIIAEPLVTLRPKSGIRMQLHAQMNGN